MANEIKGELTLAAGDETYTLVADINALCLAEAELGLESGEFVPKLGSGNLRQLRAVLWAALQTHHEHMTLADAGDLLTELGPPAVSSALVMALAKAFPPKKEAAPKGGARPPTRRKAKATATA